jgi:hypothetical protein
MDRDRLIAELTTKVGSRAAWIAAEMYSNKDAHDAR